MTTIQTTYSNTKPQTTILTTFPKIHTTEINIHTANIKSTLINNPITSNLIISSSFTSDIDNSNTIIEPSTCNYFLLIEKLCSYENYTNSEIYEKLKKEIIPTYPPDGISIIIEGKNNTVFQLTTNKNEINSLNGSNINKYNLSIIDLTELEKLLNKKEDNTYNENIPLIIFKYEKYNTSSSEKNIQYEIYDQNTKDKLNLSIYNNEINTIDIYIPITFDEKIKNLYIDLNNSGYDLLDINNCFYNDICTPYKSEYDTDVLLSDKIKDYYMNKAFCQSNCKYSKYFYLENILKCECYIDDKNINISKLGEYDDKLFIENIYKNQKNSNFKSMKCTNLIFRGKSFKKNIGCIIMFLYFLLYLVFVIIYIIQRLNPLKIKEIKIILNIEENDIGNNNIQNTINYDENKINDNNKNNVKINDLKNKDEKNKNNLTLNENNINENSKEKFTDNVKKENKIISDDTTYNNINSSKIKNKDSIDYLKVDNMKVISNNINESRNKRSLKNKKDNSTLNTNTNNVINVINLQIIKSDLELNNLDYIDALKFDKRSFFKIYCSIVKREVIVLLISFLWKDYNLLNCKMARLVFILSTYMAMNVIFFDDNSIHKIYLNYGKYNFRHQIPKIIYAIIITKIIEVFVCFLTLTDKLIYKILGFKIDKNGKKETMQIFKCINIKIIIYFIVFFLLIIFYWYLVTAFCAVFENIQITFIKNYLLSLIFSLIYPVILYLIPTGLRIMAFKDVIKKYSNIIYRMSTLIPIF